MMIGYVIVCAILLMLFMLGLVINGDAKDLLLEEGGLIETASVIGYFLCAILIVYKREVAHLRHYLILITFFALRELDLDKRYTAMGIFKARFYVSADVSVAEKIIGGMVILLLLYAVISILALHAKQFYASLRRGSEVAVGALIAIGFLVVSKSIDGYARKLEDIGVSVSAQASMHAMAIEEILELGIPMIVFLTLIAHFKAGRKGREGAD